MGEAWRGPCVHWVATDERGRLTRVKITDPSFLNWPGLTHAVPGNIIPDFPVINKSFNLSHGERSVGRLPRMFKIIVDSLRTGILTEPRPFDVRPPFGFPVIDFPKCTGCEECARACPTGAIHTGAAGPGQRTLSLSYATCIQCRACVEACPEKAVSGGRCRSRGIQPRAVAADASFDVNTATGACTFRQMEMQAGPSLDESAATLRDRIRGRLGRSLHVRQVDAGLQRL